MKLGIVVPVAFYAPEHVRLTDRFMRRAIREPDVDYILVYNNGGPLSRPETLDDWRRGPRWVVHDAAGWPFYRMWNSGIESMKVILGEDALVAILNNDIEWDRGYIAELARYLDANPKLLAASPRTRRRMCGYCFVVRADVFSQIPKIDERYQIWCGDRELGLNLRGRIGQYGDPPRHAESSTSVHVPNIDTMRRQDRELYLEKWGKAR